METAQTAVLFDIQRFCLQDGPGIRTTVFFKGCPLRCQWCHNPESLRIAPQLTYRAHKCAHCGACADVCPVNAQRFEGGAHRYVPESCIHCGRCAEVCCYGALELLGRRWSLAELLAAMQPDMPYFATGGGVTLSGGEPMMQAAFATAFAKAIKQCGVHVAVETCGYAPPEAFEAIAPYVDLFLFDFKATGEETHRLLTGVSQEPILANLHLLNALQKPITLRCPLVPDVNDSPVHLAAIAETVQRYPAIRALELLPYHRMGETKRVQLGQAMSLPDVQPPTDERKQIWLTTLARLGCEARLS